ncbi:mannosyl-oligosaccharide glucosidase [Scheffersomyces xylosifermentans]|uniref:mannosyl-oligosaccharide glucosidase n=1 Tax=Scheffersomyces xylosifermentans TaxID=1304137 RepID=UPI00315DD30C
MRLPILANALIALFALSFCAAEQVKFDILADSEDTSQWFNSDLEHQYSHLSNDSLLWGPYRSALYFGLRPRIPRSLLSGLMWFNMDNYDSIGKLRHFYEQGDNMKRANWVSYDPRIGGRQIIDDVDSHIKIIIDFVKSEDGKSWGVKVKAVPHKGFENVKTSFIWYSGLESKKDNDEDRDSSSGYLKLENQKNVLGYKGNVKLSGVSEELGLFEIEINDGPKTNKHPSSGKIMDPDLDPSRAHHYSLRVPNDNVWKARDIFITMLQESIKDLVEKYPQFSEFPPEQAFIIRDLHNFEGNLHFIQKVYEGACEFDVVYTNAITTSNDKITFDNINVKIKRALDGVNEKFEQKFSLNKPFNKSKKFKAFGKELLSGLLGGISYVYGDHLVDRETVFDEDSFESYELVGSFEGPHELFTLVPSRPFFPRGFLWDEGFHLLPLLKYDSDLVLEIMKSWFNLIDDGGWIAREQIIGPESRSRVPKQFQVQSPEIVNPPTLMLAFTFLLENVKGENDLGSIDEPNTVDGDEQVIDKSHLGQILLNNPELLTNYTKEIYPKLKLYYESFRRTQQGYVEEFDRGTNREAYRWRGRTVSHCLASGIDDYPRPLPADVAELNVDLLSWVGVMSRSMKMIASLLKLESDVSEFGKHEKDIIENLERLHWSDKDQVYCDLSVNEDDENSHECHKGYISLFPFLTKLIPEDKIHKLEAMINLIADPEELWSDFGIRSLSKSDEYYRTGENYWKSPIWININYLIIDSIQHYYGTSHTHMSEELKEKFKTVYKNLRVNIINNVVDKWESTGYVWEQYDDATGKEKGAKNFLGWSSAVLLMMNMPEEL